MLKEKLKQEIDALTESQLKQVESLIASIKLQADQHSTALPLWQTATPAERAKDLEKWASQFPETGGGLPDAAYDRESIYYGE